MCRTKCDNQRPACGFCVAAGGECIYPDADTTKFDRASQAILDRIRVMEANILDGLKNLKSGETANGAVDNSKANYLQTNGRCSTSLHRME